MDGWSDGEMERWMGRYRYRDIGIDIEIEIEIQIDINRLDQFRLDRQIDKIR